MKILFLSQGLPFPVYQDGLTVRVYHLLREFSKFAQCHLIAFGDHELTAEEAEELRTMASFDIIRYQSPAGIVGLVKKAVSNRRYYDKQLETSIRTALTTFKPDIVFCEQTFMAQYADTIKGVPKVMSAVDAISLAAMRQAEIGGSINHFLAWRYVAHQRMAFEKYFFPMFDKVTVVSKEDADYLFDLIGMNVHVIPNGVDTEYFTPEVLDDNRKTIIFTGNLSAPMNEEACIYLLREVFPKLHYRYPDIEFKIAGRSPTAEILAAKPHYVNLNADVPDIRDAYKGAIFCVSPVIYGTGIKNNILQSMSMGLPVVVTPLIAGPIHIAHGRTGLVAERGTTFVRAIETLLADRCAIEVIGRSARIHVEQCFSWRHVATAYRDLFAEMLGEAEGT